ncbi:outer dynein arm-docking complex subunit 4 [Anthonomus grandis grandis]|uniref:outer dynein arm-docking complex subunit 4 n=1 Tax=Anthonomus grandis grandis TaxID=2921223 RepID=UPI002165A528|nr:outer dynein arm-docking complex subunit 4 [Anthonomus grandis grandis]
MQSANPFGKPKDEIFGQETLHRETAYYISRLEQYENAIKHFDQAIKKTPKDQRALIGRSRARAHVSQNEGALDDINEALNLDPDNLTLLADKALNTYLCCEFEEGLVQNTRLLPLREKPENFKMGVMQCTDAIENCVGDRCGRPLRDYFKMIRKLAWERNYAAQKPFEPIARNRPKKKPGLFEKMVSHKEGGLEPVQPLKLVKLKGKSESDENLLRESLHSISTNKEPIPPYHQNFPFRPLQQHTTNIENYIAEKYLDKMYLDKVFLNKLESMPGTICPNAKGVTRIKQIVKNCYKTVSYKQEVLRTRRPFYFIKYREARVSGALKKRQEMELAHQQYFVKLEAESILANMMAAYEQKRLQDFLNLTEKLRRYCDMKSKKLLPAKSDYMTAIYQTACKAFYDVYRLNPGHSSYLQNKRLYAILGIPLSREPSTDSVIREFKNVFVDHKKLISTFEVRLKNAVDPLEICWYYHELARLQLEEKHFDLSRVYARKCIYEASKLKNEMWIFNCAMLMCKSNIQQHNKSDAKNDIRIAQRSARKLNDKEKDEYLEKCLNLIDTVQFDDVYGAKELQRREQKIIQMMGNSKMKDEVAHLFRIMSAMPANRRMTVIPGVVVKSGLKENKGRSMSIMPNKDNPSSVELKEVSKSSQKLMQDLSLHMEY